MSETADALHAIRVAELEAARRVEQSRADAARSVAAVGIAGIRRKLSPTPFASEEFFTGCDRVRERFAALVNGQPERVAILPAASYGIATAARNIPLQPGQRIVILGEQFPSNVYVWRRLAGPDGATSSRPVSSTPRWRRRWRHSKRPVGG